MFKKAVRLSVIMMLVVSIALGAAVFQTGEASASVNSGYNAEPIIMDIPWDGSTNVLDWDYSKAYLGDTIFISNTMTVAQLRSDLEGALGYPVVILFDTWKEGGFVATTPSDFDLVSAYICTFNYNHYHMYVFKADSGVDITRLTLFGYVKNGSKDTCTLWSLDGRPNASPNEKCGGEVKLVCTVKLVGKSLKYECEDGYQWVGNQISTDSRWIAWADKFARKYGR